MKKTIWAIFLIVIIVLAAPGHAEIYKYIDENGQKRWTDDLSQVPEDQRPAAQRLVTEENETATGNAADAPTPKHPPSHVPDTGSMVPGTDELSRDALVKEKAQIQEQYRQLMEERQKLQQAIAEAPNGKNRAELNKQAAAYNQKAEAYDNRLNDFNKKVAQYNQQISAAQEKAAE